MQPMPTFGFFHGENFPHLKTRLSFPVTPKSDQIDQTGQLDQYSDSSSLESHQDEFSFESAHCAFEAQQSESVSESSRPPVLLGNLDPVDLQHPFATQLNMLNQLRSFLSGAGHFPDGDMDISAALKLLEHLIEQMHGENVEKAIKSTGFQIVLSRLDTVIKATPGLAIWGHFVSQFRFAIHEELRYRKEQTSIDSAMRLDIRMQAKPQSGKSGLLGAKYGALRKTNLNKKFWLSEIHKYQSELEAIELITKCQPVTESILVFLDNIDNDLLTDEDVLTIKYQLFLIESHCKTYLTQKADLDNMDKIRVDHAVYQVKMIGSNLKDVLRLLQNDLANKCPNLKPDLFVSTSIDVLCESQRELTRFDLDLIQQHLTQISTRCKESIGEKSEIDCIVKTVQEIEVRFHSELLPSQRKVSLIEKLRNLRAQLSDTLKDRSDLPTIAYLFDFDSNPVDYMSNLNLAKLSFGLDDLAALLLRHGSRFDPAVLKDMGTSIGQLQNECAVAWQLQTDSDSDVLNSPDLNVNAAQELINSLRAIRPILQEFTAEPSCEQEIGKILLVLAQSKNYQDPAQLAIEVHSRLMDLQNALEAVHLNKQYKKYSLTFLNFQLSHLVEISESLLEPIAAPSKAGGIEWIRDMLDSMRPVLTSAWICSDRGATMFEPIATLNSLDQLTPGNTQYLFSKLDQLAVSLDAIADANDPNFESIGFVVRNLNCLRTVLKNSCPPIDKPDEPGNLKTDAEFLEMLRAISIPLRGLGPRISAKISFVMGKLAKLSEVPMKEKAVQPSKGNERIEASDSLKNDRQRLRLEELARISLELDKIVGQVEAYPDDLICNGVKLGFIKKNLTYLAFVGGTRFTEQAHEAAVNDLTAYYKKLFKYAYSSMRTFGLKGGVSLSALLPLFPDFMKIMSAGFGGSHTRGIAIDDENYPGRLKKWTVTVQAKIDAGFFEAGGKGSLSYGSYEEWDTIRKYVTANIADLANTYSVCPTGIQKYLGGLQYPVVSDYLSRHHILKQAGLKTYLAKWWGTDIFRIDRMEVLQQKYDDQFERISQSFSVLLSILNTKTAPGSQSEIALQNIDIGDGSGLNLSLRANSVNASGGIGVDMPFLKAGGTYSFDRDSTSLDLVVSTPVCEKMADLESEVAEKLTLNKIHRGELESDVSNPFDEIAEKRKRLEQLNTIKLERTNLLQTIRNEIYVKSAGLRSKFDADHATRTLALGNRYEFQTGKAELPWSHQYGATGIPKSSIEIEMVDLTHKFQSLQRDFQAYLTFQSQLSTATTKHEKSSAKATIKKFHSMYGANDSIDCMVRLISLNAWLYTALGELEQRSSNFPDLAMLIKVSKQSIRDFEVRLNKPTFALDRKKVTELSAFRRKAQLETIDVKHTLKCAGGVTIANAGWSKAQQAGHTDSVLFRHREHPHPMRTGDFRDYEFRFGAYLNMSNGMAQSLVTQVFKTDHIADIPMLQQCLEKQFSLMNAGEENVFTFRFFKPSQAIFPGLDFRPLYFRKTKVSNHALTPNVAVSPGVTVGLSYEKSTTTFGDEEYSSDSIWNFLLRYFHDFGVAHISETGECSEEGLWLDIATEQRTSLTELFEKFALECAIPTKIAPKNSMREELNVIEKAIFRLRISDEARKKIKDARIEFAECTKAFQNSKTAANYNRTLISFQNLMLAYCPHIRKMKRNSPLYSALPFTLPNT